MSTFKTLLQLSQMATKNDYLNYVSHELNAVTQTLQNAGYNINANAGLVGRQSLNTLNDIVNFEYFREMHFIYHGLSGNGWTYDPVDQVYFIGLQGFVTSQYNHLP